VQEQSKILLSQVLEHVSEWPVAVK
jgi:hypothetical protein